MNVAPKPANNPIHPYISPYDPSQSLQEYLACHQFEQYVEKLLIYSCNCTSCSMRYSLINHAT